MRMRATLAGIRLPCMFAFWAALALLPSGVLHAQDLAPRAYIITPLHSNAVTLTWSHYSGGLNFNGAVPITGATGDYSVSIFTGYHSFSFFGRSANITASLPYGVGNFEGDVFGSRHTVYHSGLLDFSTRLSVNLLGGKAMQPQQYAKWKQKVILGASLKIVAPTGQYDPMKVVNWGINRWAFKPEFGYSQRWGRWILDGYAGAWFYTTNSASFNLPVPSPQTQSPIGSFEGHVSYDFPGKRTWASLDGNFWWGGTATLDGVAIPSTRQTSSRLGGTVSLPVPRTKRQSIKIAYSGGSYSRFGGNYQNVQVAWQYSWLGRPN